MSEHRTKIKGFSIIEMLVVIAIIIALSGTVLSAFVSYRKSQSLSLDTEAVVGTLLQARNQTISSKNASVYGVNFSTNSVTLFAGPTFNQGDPNNQVLSLSPGNTLATTLSPATAITFNRITGETNATSTVSVLITGELGSTTIKIYKTGVVEKVNP
jgi:prepilin-type N-terminal cleavage/methylation domain-containing protein